jgi:hypothetical protein
VGTEKRISREGAKDAKKKQSDVSLPFASFASFASSRATKSYRARARHGATALQIRASML